MIPVELIITLKNDIEELTGLLDRAEHFGKEAGLSMEQIHAIMLSLDEAVTNTISYGYPQGGEHTIQVRLIKENDCLTVTIEDDGVAFDPLQAPPADLTLSVEERPIGGLGIHFMRSFMDSLSYRREGNKNLFTLNKKL